jgi:hypothetical protein
MRDGATFARLRIGACLVLAALAQGCVTDEGIKCALTDVNREFKEQYERILDEKGTRAFAVRPAEAFSGTRAALFRLGMRLESQSLELGLMSVAAPAPAPLSMQEWKIAADADLPMMQRLAARCIGLPAYLFEFEPQGLEIVINATVLPALGGSEIALTMRMRQVKPPPSGMPRREYAPPTGVRMGLDKIWGQVEKELGVRARSL